MGMYIKTEDAIPYLTRYIPSVDAVESSMINKAIEEMNNIDLNEYADNSYQLVNKCIEILKRNIGE